MAGAGKRFRDAGYNVAKPLIDVLGRPMYSWAADSLPFECGENIIFILLENQEGHDFLEKDIKSRYAKYDPIIITLPKLTRGQAETVLSAKSYINNEYPLLIHNADTGFKIKPYWLDDIEKTRPDGALLVFVSKEKRWSFSRQDATGRVVEVKEKEPISEFASTGTYYFGKGSKFVELAEKRIKSNFSEVGEFYVAPLYNDLIAEGGIVKNYLIERLICFGTPKDLQKSLRLMDNRNETSLIDV